jgi:hypothetical protein
MVIRDKISTAALQNPNLSTISDVCAEYQRLQTVTESGKEKAIASITGENSCG